jgi:hypothetical protein
MDLHTSASLYPAISETDLLRLPFPKIARRSATEQITSAVQSARAARQRASRILEAAQRAVELAIEQDEKAAIKCLESQTRLTSHAKYIHRQ